MPIAKSSIERNSFVKGLITEATALTFPENAALDLRNFELNRDGSIKRRLGMAIESLGTSIDTGRTATSVGNYAIQTYKWTNVNNDSTVSIGVVQVGNQLWFTDLSSDTQSTNMLNKDASGNVQSILLDDSILTKSISGNEPLSFASIAGVLIVASKELDYPFYLEYKGASDTDGSPVNVQEIRIEVRDLWGVFDGLPVNERPSTLSDEHKYNLYNQGWIGSTTAVTQSFKRVGESTTTLYYLYPDLFTSPTGNYKTITKSPIKNQYRGGTSRQYYKIKELQSLYPGSTGATEVVAPPGSVKGYPSNSDIRYTGNSTNSSGDPVFDPDLLDLDGATTSPAPKGRYIIEAFNRGASRTQESGIAGLALDEEEGNISAVATYANRVFYSGVDSVVTEPQDESPDYTGSIFFTQSIENFKQFNKCYQSADPTSENDFALVATDGGVIKIAEASNIVKLVQVRASLVVMAENGVWEITGPDGVFKADEFSISQVTNIGCKSADSVVVAEDTVTYWAEGGIYALSADQVSGKLNAQNITETTIQTFLNDIPTVAKQFVKGRFDPVNRKITWMYCDSDSCDGVLFQNKYNKELVYDTVLQAFYVHEIGDATDGTYIAAYIETENFVVVEDLQNVVVNGEQVVSNGEDVVVAVPTRGRGESTTKYLTLAPTGTGSTYEFSFALYRESDYLDWGEVDSPAYLITGYELGGETQRNKQIPYLTMHFNRTESGFEEVNGELEAVNPSSCKVQTRWDFADSATSGKWGTQFEAYRLRRNYIPSGVGDGFDYGYSVVTTKTKIRGSGVAVSFKFETTAAKDCQIIGWGMPVTGGTVV
jgi:hypothetical protein